MRVRVPRPPTRNPGRRWGGVYGLALVAIWVSASTEPAWAGVPPPPASSGADEEAGEPARATLRVRGLGILGNRMAGRACLRLLDDAKSRSSFPSSFVEDTSLLLLDQVQDEGFLQARIEITLTLRDGSVKRAVCQRGELMQLPVEWQATEVEFDVVKGRRYHFAELRFEGLEGRSARRAEDYFYPPGGLLNLKGERPYSPGRYERSLKNLRQEWWNQGYRRAKVETQNLVVDDRTGEVRAIVRVDRGPRLRVRTLTVNVHDAAGEPPITTRSQSVNLPFTLAWEQDTLDASSREQYAEGYAETTGKLEVTEEAALGDEAIVDVVVAVLRGPRIGLGQVAYTGQQHTRDWVLRGRTELTGPWLNRIEVDRARERLSRLGIFKSVYVEYEEATNGVRDVRFAVEEGRRTEIRAIAGYGSYDLLFGGAELSEYNVFGIGHNARLYGTQSFKSTVGRVTYAVPEFMFPDTTAFASGNLLLRDELTFERRELGGSVGLLKAFPRAGQQVGLRYSYEYLRAESGAVAAGPTDTRVGAVVLDWTIERRKSPLRPRSGYHAFSGIEIASTALGGEARYQRLELGGSLHLPLTRSLFLHAGLWHGVVTDVLNKDDAVPFNKRFFPGGANSVRGYQYGEASPMDASGNQLGAASSIVGNLEVEKALTSSWSLVAFLDGVGNALEISAYPVDEFLASAGAGIRWNTPIGPVRLEYGYNLNPRAGDPDGTVHVSVGFPF